MKNNEIEYFEDLTTRQERMNRSAIDQFDTIERSIGLLIIILAIVLIISIILNAIK